MAFFSTSFSFDAPSSRPESHYTYGTALDSISPTSSRCGSPSSPSASSTPSTTSSSPSDDLYTLTSHLSSSSLYTPSRFQPPGRRSPPRSNPYTMPPNVAPQQPNLQQQPPVDMLARRERRQAYVAEQLSSQSRRKLSLLVARMLGDEIDCGSARKHPNDGLHPSNVRVVPAVPGVGRNSRRNTLAEVSHDGSDVYGQADGDDAYDHPTSAGGVCESIEVDLPVRPKEGANRISKKSIGRGAGRKLSSRPKR